MKTLGMNKRQIATQLRAARVSGRQLSATLSGKFIPVNVSRTVQKNIFDNNLRSQFPVKEIAKIRKEYAGKPLAVETKEPQPEVSVEPVQQPVAATATPPAVAQAGAAPAQTTAAPALSSQPQNSGGIMSFLSSGNPIDAIKNLQIFQRAQQ